MKEYKIIFSDIDGTLLNNENQVPEETIEELRRLDSQGVPFVLVSVDHRISRSVSLLGNTIFAIAFGQYRTEVRAIT